MRVVIVVSIDHQHFEEELLRMDQILDCKCHKQTGSLSGSRRDPLGLAIFAAQPPRASGPEGILPKQPSPRVARPK